MNDFDHEQSEYENNTTGDVRVTSARAKGPDLELDLLIRMPDEDMIASAIAQRMVTDYSLSKSLRDLVLNHTMTSIQAQIDDMLKTLVNEHIMRPFPVINPATGEATGESLTLRDVIVSSITNWETQTVDATGKPEQKTAYNNAKPRRQYIIEQVAGAAFDKEAKAAVAAVLAEAKTTQAEKLKAVVAAAIGGLMK